jgi:hypothetical protein
MAFAFSLLLVIAVTTPAATAGAGGTAQQPPVAPPAPAAPKPDCSKTDLPAAEAMTTAARCVGWLNKPGDQQRSGEALGLGPLLANAGTAALAGLAGFGGIPAGALTNEFLSLIAEIAVDRARRQGLAFIKERIQSGVCDLKFHEDPMGQVLPATCTLVTTSDLQVLVGDGKGLRAALGSDVIDIVSRRVHLTASPVERSAIAALALLKRFVADPDLQLTKNDVWLVVDAFLNEPWNATGDDIPAGVESLQYGIAAARVYVQALQMVATNQRSQVDLAFIIREVKKLHDNTGPTSPQILEYANLASKAVVATNAKGSEDYVGRLRAAVTLIFQSMATMTRPGEDGKPKPLIPLWIRPAVAAVLDADAPHLIAAIADAAKDRLIKDCTTGDDCRQVRKFSALLTGVATYALTYDNKIPEDATAEQRLAFQKDQREARKEALESVIDAATDRNGRGGTAVWSLGVGVGGTMFTRQRIDAATAGAGTASGLTEKIGFQLQVPLGIAYQLLPSKKWYRPVPIHFMASFLDLGNYVGKTPEPDKSPDWRAIIAPGVQAAVAVPFLSRPSNLVLIGYSWTYAPQYVEGESPSTSTGFKSSRRRGVFVNYYVPLWDFN